MFRRHSVHGGIVFRGHSVQGAEGQGIMEGIYTSRGLQLSYPTSSPHSKHQKPNTMKLLQGKVLTNDPTSAALNDALPPEKPDSHEHTQYYSKRPPNQSGIHLILCSSSFNRLKTHIYSHYRSSDPHPLSRYITLSSGDANERGGGVLFTPPLSRPRAGLHGSLGLQVCGSRQASVAARYCVSPSCFFEPTVAMHHGTCLRIAEPPQPRPYPGAIVICIPAIHQCYQHPQHP